MNVTVSITPNDKNNPPGKLCDAELRFGPCKGCLAGGIYSDVDCQCGPLVGLKLIGFAVWERRGRGGRNVTFPARQYSVNGERRSFALLRPVEDVDAQAPVREMILSAYAEYEAKAALAS